MELYMHQYSISTAKIQIADKNPTLQDTVLNMHQYSISQRLPRNSGF